MRIAEIHVYQMDLALRGKPYRMSGGAHEALDSTIVQVVSDTGVSGWGETCPIGPTYQPEHALGARAALDQMSPGLVGSPVTGPLATRRAMDRLLNGHNYAKAAVDIAMHDLIGKAHGIRVCDMLGGATVSASTPTTRSASGSRTRPPGPRSRSSPRAIRGSRSRSADGRSTWTSRRSARCGRPRGAPASRSTATAR